MTTGREKSEWRRTSNQMQLMANLKRKTPLAPDYFYPFKDPPRELSVAEREAIIKASWIDKPTAELSNAGQ